MRFNTHETTPKQKTTKAEIIVMCVVLALVCGFFAMLSWAIVADGRSGLLLILYPGIALLIGLVAALATDTTRAYVEINGEDITAVDYYFFIKREKRFKLSDLEHAAIWGKTEHCLHGYALTGKQYIEFRGAKNRYLFKVMAYPETIAFFGRYVDIENQS